MQKRNWFCRSFLSKGDPSGRSFSKVTRNLDWYGVVISTSRRNLIIQNIQGGVLALADRFKEAGKYSRVKLLAKATAILHATLDSKIRDTSNFSPFIEGKEGCNPRN